MDKLRQKLTLTKAKTYHGEEQKGLDAMVRESMYFVWPMASVDEKCERNLERFMTHEDEVFEGDVDEG